MIFGVQQAVPGRARVRGDRLNTLRGLSISLSQPSQTLGHDDESEVVTIDFEITSEPTTCG
jgi:hypothetical protein